MNIKKLHNLTITIKSEFSEDFPIMFMDSGDAIKKILVVTLKK